MKSAPPMPRMVPRDLTYRVSTWDRERLRLERVDCMSVPRTMRGRPCHEVLEGRPDPCEGCPIIESEPRSVAVTPLPSGGGLCLITIVREAHSAEVRRVCLEDDELGALVRARLAQRLERARLTPQEKRVVERLACGESIEAVAQALGIAARTVKYHVGHALRKLGLASRSELTQLLLSDT